MAVARFERLGCADMLTIAFAPLLTALRFAWCGV